MKYALALLFAAVAMTAQATNTPAPAPTPAQPANATATARADAVAAQKQAQAQRQAQKQAQGQQQGQKSSNTNSNAATGGEAGDSAANSNSTLSGIGNSTDESRSSFKALAISLPSPVFTPPLPMSTCPQANAEQSAVAVGFGLFSHAKGSVNTDNCTAIIIYNAFLAQCKYESAQQVLNMLTIKVLPEWKPQAVLNIDLTTKECVELLKPIPPANPVKTVDNYIYVEKPCAAPAPTPIAKKRKPVPKPVGVCK